MGSPQTSRLASPPVLAQQLASDSFKAGLVEYLKDRRRRVAADREEFLEAGGDRPGEADVLDG